MEHIAEKLCPPFSHALAIFVCDTGFHSSNAEPEGMGIKQIFIWTQSKVR